MLRLFYRTRGAFEIRIDFNPELDLAEFSHRLGGDFNAFVHFAIDDEGNYQTNFGYDFKQKENAWQWFDYSTAKSVGIDRARKLSGPDAPTEDTWEERYRETMDLYPKLNFSFEYSDMIKGKW